MLFTLLTLACAGKPSTHPDSPYEEDSPAGCTFEWSSDEGGDGSVDATASIIWDTLLDSNGGAYQDEWHYAHVDGRFEDLVVEGRVSGECQTSYVHLTFDGSAYSGTRATSVCDEGGYFTSYAYDVADEGGAWEYHGEAVNVNEYGSDGLIAEVQSAWTYADDTEYGYTSRYTWEGGRKVEMAWEDAADGTVNRALWGYDGKGHEVLYTVDYGDDGTIAVELTSTWDDDNLVANSVDYYNFDFHGGGSYQYDDHGRLTAFEVSSTYGGEPYEDYTVEYTWDASHYRLATSSFDDVLDDSRDYERTYSYQGGADGHWPWAGSYIEQSDASPTVEFSYECP